MTCISCVATFILLCSTVCGFTLDLLHKSHPSIAHYWSSHSKLGKPYEANISFSGQYVVHLEVGTPPYKLFAVFDTGSSLFWLQTSTCDQCLPQPEETRYDPTRSSTFEHVGCTEPDCAYLHLTANTHCKNDTPDFNGCLYDVVYGDGTKSSGYLATDIFTFMDGLSVRLLMGVGTRNSRGKEIIMGAPPGTFGMSRSAWYQFQNKFQTTQFSYCMPADTNEVGYVKFGEAAVFSGPSVKYYPENKLFYALSLTGVSFNDKPLKPPSQDSWEGFRMILDTGLSVSRIHPDLLGPLQAELENFFGEEYIGVHGYSMCWPDISADNENVKSMTITLHFNDIEFKLSQPQIWQPVQVGAGDSISEFYCINLMENASGRESVLGTMQTTNKNIAINWVAGEVAIEDRIC